MSLQDLELSPFLISELYRDALVAVKTSEIIEETPIVIKSKPSELTGYVPADTASLGLPPITAKAPAAAIETPEFKKPEPAKSQKPAEEAVTVNHPEPSKTPKSAEPIKAEQSTPTTTIKFLGGNKKRIAFIVNCATDVFLPDNHLDWLGKMLDACKLNLGDVAIANIANNQFTITDIKNELLSTSVILLGTEPFAIQLPLNFPHFNLQSYDGITFLYTPSPDQLNQPTHEAKLLKSKLWVSLQKLFKL